jgi:hypothetical protein
MTLARCRRRANVDALLVEQYDRLAVVGHVDVEHGAAHAHGGRRRLNLVGGLGARARDEAKRSLSEIDGDGSRRSVCIDKLVEDHPGGGSDRELRLVQELSLAGRIQNPSCGTISVPMQLILQAMDFKLSRTGPCYTILTTGCQKCRCACRVLFAARARRTIGFGSGCRPTSYAPLAARPYWSRYPPLEPGSNLEPSIRGAGQIP